ncbi:MAG: TonB family protein [Candidatus Coatesbacteria bacterium]|nr:MAG: TonB family protein [Candidatus Coatesbacteria bacterium]
MVKTIKAAQARLKRKLSGGLFRYTLLFSLALHLGLWGILGWPGGGIEQGAFLHSDRDPNITIITIPEFELPPPATIDPFESPVATGIPGREEVGMPIPVPDKDAEFDTIRPPSVERVAPVTENTEIIVLPSEKAPPPTSANPNVPEIVPTSRSPVIIHKERPKYPEIARGSGFEGDVILLVYIDERGHVRNAVVQHSPGLPALEASALEAAYRCKFQPAEQQGVPVGVWYSLVMQFKQ